jgi:hypothetical protein
MQLKQSALPTNQATSNAHASIAMATTKHSPVVAKLLPQCTMLMWQHHCVMAISLPLRTTLMWLPRHFLMHPCCPHCHEVGPLLCHHVTNDTLLPRKFSGHW